MNMQTDITIKPQSNSKLDLVPRIVRFDYSDIQSRNFFSDNPIENAFWAALMATFPAGEAEFIHSLNNYKDVIKDKKLLKEMQDFAAQESHHGLQHKKLTKQLQKAGFALEGVEKVIAERLAERIEGWTPKQRIIRTVCAEHMTAVIGHYGLSNPESLEQAHDSIRKVLQWHAIEEVEHKSVAFDVYKAAEGDMGALKRDYALFLFFVFPIMMTKITRFLLKESGEQVTWAHRWGFFKHLFSLKRGVFGSMFGHLLAFLKPGFHPWDVDDSALIESYKKDLAPYFANV